MTGIRRALAVAGLAAAALTACRTPGPVADPTSPPAPAATTALPAAGSPPATQPPQPGALKQVHDPGEVTGTIPARCTYRDGGQLPDPACTPGAIDPSLTVHDLCIREVSRGRVMWVAHTRQYRPPSSQTSAFKYDEAYPAYGVPPRIVTELDHKVPIALAGANDASNLWPERPPTPNPKDAVEDALHDWVCSAPGRPSAARLGAAQQAIAANWTTAEARLRLSG